MAVDKTPILKRCRSLGMDPVYLGVDKKSKRHPQNSRRKVSEYGLQLRAKQQAKRYYCIQESQFYKYFLMAERKQGVTGENLLRICESRLDNVVYLLG